MKLVAPAKCTRRHTTKLLARPAPHFAVPGSARSPTRRSMTIPPAHDDYDPGRRRDPIRPRTDRRRARWGEFPRNYPGSSVTATVALLIFVAADAWLVMRYLRYRRETAELRASMSDVERKRTDELLAQNENRLKVMVGLFKSQANLDQTL